MFPLYICFNYLWARQINKVTETRFKTKVYLPSSCTSNPWTLCPTLWRVIQATFSTLTQIVSLLFTIRQLPVPVIVAMIGDSVGAPPSLVPAPVPSKQRAGDIRSLKQWEPQRLSLNWHKKRRIVKLITSAHRLLQASRVWITYVLAAPWTKAVPIGVALLNIGWLTVVFHWVPGLQGTWKTKWHYTKWLHTRRRRPAALTSTLRSTIPTSNSKVSETTRTSKNKCLPG